MLALHREVLDALSARYGDDSAAVETALADTGRTLFEMGDYSGAAAEFEHAVAIIEQLASIDAEVAFAARTGSVEDQAVARSATFDLLVKSYARLAQQQPDRATTYVADAFSIAQRVIESQAAGALAQMSARQASGSGALAALVRERQDLVVDWQHEDSALTLALTATDLDGAGIAQFEDETRGHRPADHRHRHRTCGGVSQVRRAPAP